MCAPGCLTSGYSVLTDFVILFPSLWKNPPSCHHGAECKLQIHQGRGEYSECAWVVYLYPLPCNGGFWVSFLIRFLGSVSAESAEDRALQVQHVESK